MKRLHSEAGTTLTEVMISTAVLAICTAALFAGAGTIQKAFVALEDYVTGKSDQMRLSDYLSLDLRRALTVDARGTGGTTLLTITIPDYYDSDGNPRMPHLISHKASYGDPEKPITVIYSKEASSIYREEVGKSKVVIASNVEDFEVTLRDLDKVVKNANYLRTSVSDGDYGDSTLGYNSHEYHASAE